MLLTVVQDLENGRELIPGAPRMRVIDEHTFGGMVDRQSMAVCGPSESPVVWHVSADQARLIMHQEPLADRMLVYGSEGGGKSVTLAMWCALRAVEFTGAYPRREIGITAPTGPRLKMMHQTMSQWWPGAWHTWVEREGCFFLANGVTVRLISTHQVSAREGSRIQGYNWSAAGSDEMQDSIDRDADIEARLRSAPCGRPKRLATATAKDSSDWRAWRDAAMATGLWQRSDLIANRSPFIYPSYIDQLRRTLTKREFDRRQGAQDVPPERMVYTSWSRPDNIRARPRGEHSATTVLDRSGGPFGMLIGHDPGRRYRYSVFLLPYLARGDDRPHWWVVDEVWNDTGTVEDHVVAVLAKLRERWACNVVDRFGRLPDHALRALVRTDIYTDNGHDEKHPDRSVYALFRKHGISILPALQRAAANGQMVPSQIPKNARIDMLNTLFEKRRLLVDVDDMGRPVAPKLVAAIESLERDPDGRAETAKKGPLDQSHFAAALGYGLYSLERARVTDRVHLESVP
ncbi:MAG TPA: hypothetical protein PLV92_00365 [Pirellulaceae bacterium]|nr:hypothetical protein [Pirellulaceae bacterium]